MRRTVITFGPLFLAAFTVACPPLDEPGPGDVLEATCPTSDRGLLVAEAPAGNVTLYLSNQSFQRSPVDFKVELDWTRIIEVALDVCQQHEFVGYRFDWASGDHVLRVSSKHGLATDLTFVTIGDDPIWGFVSYWFDADDDAGKFQFHFQNEPIYFQ
jgi:hypothetical protein